MSLRHQVLGGLALGSGLLASAVPAAAVTTENFYLRSGADVVALCSTPSNDALYTAAVHFCQGFGVGVYQTVQALTAHDKLEPLMCPPAPPPTRNETVAQFLVWANAHPQDLGASPADLVGRFLIERFPCPKAPK